MCRCVPASVGSPRTFSAEWLNDSGRVVHPAAPDGVGGPGAFRSAGVFASDGSSELLPHPSSPAVKTLDPSLVKQADELEAAKVVRQPPPKVAADSTETINGMSVTLKKDASGAAGVTGAITDFENKATGKISKTADDAGVVTSVTNTLKWTLVIQTRYGSGTPEADSAYGRGTTKADKESGNVSLGFHESCHRNDLMGYFRSTAVPELTAKKGQSDAEAQTAIDAYTAAWEAYFAKARADTLQATDEVGDPTLSAFEAAP